MKEGVWKPVNSLHSGKPEKAVLCTLLKQCLFIFLPWKLPLQGRKLLVILLEHLLQLVFKWLILSNQSILRGILIIMNNQEEKRDRILCYFELFETEVLPLIRSASNWDLTNICYAVSVLIQVSPAS